MAGAAQERLAQQPRRSASGSAGRCCSSECTSCPRRNRSPPGVALSQRRGGLRHAAQCRHPAGRLGASGEGRAGSAGGGLRAPCRRAPRPSPASAKVSPNRRARSRFQPRVPALRHDAASRPPTGLPRRLNGVASAASARIPRLHEIVPASSRRIAAASPAADHQPVLGAGQRHVEQPVVFLGPLARRRRRAGGRTAAQRSSLRGAHTGTSTPVARPRPTAPAPSSGGRPSVSGRITSGACNPFAPCTVMMPHHVRRRPPPRASPRRRTAAASARSPAARADASARRSSAAFSSSSIGSAASGPSRASSRARAAERSQRLGQQRVRGGVIDAGEQRPTGTATPPASPPAPAHGPATRPTASPAAARRQRHQAVVGRARRAGWSARSRATGRPAAAAACRTAPAGRRPPAGRSAPAGPAPPPARRAPSAPAPARVRRRCGGAPAPARRPARSGRPRLSSITAPPVCPLIQSASASARRCMALAAAEVAVGHASRARRGATSGTGASGHSSTLPACPARSARWRSVSPGGTTPAAASGWANTASTSPSTGAVERNDTSSVTSRQTSRHRRTRWRSTPRQCSNWSGSAPWNE